jgi:cytochrome c553
MGGAAPVRPARRRCHTWRRARYLLRRRLSYRIHGRFAFGGKRLVKGSRRVRPQAIPEEREMTKFILGFVLSAVAGLAPAQTPAGNAEAAKGKISMCTGCHGIPGYKTVFPSVYQVPMITGQQAVYIVNALQAYKSGARSHPSMRGIAQSLSDQDMADLAAYYSSDPR